MRRTARYHALGAGSAREVWVVLHGYGQLAAYFVRPFRALAGNHRRIVAPEALSRFYLQGTSGRAGATWMTREDREAEIRDTVGYLDALVRHEVGVRRAGVKLCALGFSQGAAAATRWAALGSTRLDRLVLWGGGVPDDLDLARHGDRLPDLTLVVGDADAYVPPERLAVMEARLQAAHLPYRLVGYGGGHKLDAETLRRVVEAG